MCCPCEHQSSLLDYISSISTIVTALAGFALAYYVFVYQRRKDALDRGERIIETTKNIRLDWFKTAIVQPNLDYLYDFYSKLNLKTQALKTSNISLAAKRVIVEDIKSHCYDFRRLFIDLTGAVGPHVHPKIQKNIDDLLDDLTNVIYDPGIDLSDLAAFNNKVEKPVNLSKNNLFSVLFSYQGL